MRRFELHIDRAYLSSSLVKERGTVGGKVQFPASVCSICPQKERCTSSKKGRSISIHPDPDGVSARLRDRDNPSINPQLFQQALSIFTQQAITESVF